MIRRPISAPVCPPTIEPMAEQQRGRPRPCRRGEREDTRRRLQVYDRRQDVLEAVQTPQTVIVHEDAEAPATRTTPWAAPK